jgi:hypothetical protein
MLDVIGKSFSFIENFFCCNFFFFLERMEKHIDLAKKKKREQWEREQKKWLLEQLMLL